ncbi:beta strand repeat-containing protein [Undibacterium sp. TC9W]|uniref:beta strand repeat-containing protein n=1 Tax=Undibacterium sp. TC9W TaxID=3413053 RepID=UPI003BEF6BB7
MTAGGVFNGTAGLNENFTGNVAALVGTTVNGNGSDSDTITISGGGTVSIGNGNTITNIKTLATDNTATNVNFTVATSGITTINGGTGNDNVNLTNSGSSMLAGNVNLGAGNNTLTLEGKSYSGTFVAGAGSDTLLLVNGSNISAANVSGFETVNIANNASVTMTAAQFGGFTNVAAAAGTETINYTTAGTITGTANVENYVLANGSNTFTAATGLVSVTGGTGNDTINASSAIITASTAINGGAGTDTLNVGAVTAALDMSAKVSNVETVNVTGGTTATWTVTNENGAGVTLNFTKSASTAINGITLGSGGQTLNILGTGTGASTITGGSGVDTINLSTTATGADVIVAGSNINAMDTVNNFKAAGADSFGTGVVATSLFNLTIANADSSNLAAAIATAATAAGASLANTGQAYTITVNSGTAAGTYVFQNSGSSATAVDGSDFIVKLGGTTGSIVASDFGIANAVSVTPGGTFNGVSGANDIFMSSIPGLNGTTIAGNAADTDVLTLTTAGTVNLNNGSTGGTISNVKVLNLANGTNTITYNTPAGFTTINGGSGNDTIGINEAFLPIVVNGGSGTDTIVLSATYAATASGSGAFAANVSGFEKLRLTSVTNQTIDLQTLGNYSDVTFSAANGLTLSNLPSNGNITLNGTGTAFTISNAAFVGGVNDVVNLTLTDGSTSGVSFASVGITASGVETVNISVNDTQATPTGLFNDNMTWLGNSVKTFNVSGNAGLTLSSSSTALTSVDASGITLGGFTWTASALTGAATVKGSATGTNTVIMNLATAGVNYTGGTGNDNVTINATVSSTASLGNGNNSLSLNGVTILGTYTAGTGTDTLELTAPNLDISNATITGFENLSLRPSGELEIKATIAQMSQFTGNINHANDLRLTLTTAGSFNAFGRIFGYRLANGTNNFTSNDWVQEVLGGSGSDTFNVTADQITSRSPWLNGGNGTDTLNIGATTTQNIDLSTRVSNIETINVAGSTGTASFTNANGAGVTLNYTKSTGDNTITLGTGGQALNLLGSSSAATTITGGSGVDTINLSTTATGADTIAAGSNINAIDIVNNFKAAGADKFITGVLATSLNNLNIASADTSNLAAAIATAAAAAGVSLADTGQTYTITVNSGTAAGTYAFQNSGSSVTTVDGSDFIVKLGGATGSIVTSDFGIANAVSVTAGGTFNGVSGANDIFMSSIPGLNGSTIAGNAADTDVLTLTTAGTVNINNGGTGGTISNIKVLNLANGTNNITYNTSAGITTINGGTGDDTFIPDTAVLPIVVNGGAGTDTIVLTAANAASQSGSGTFASNVTGFEKLRLTGVTNQTVDLQTLGNYNDVTFSGGSGLTLSNLPSNGNITLNGTGSAFTISNAAFAGGVNDVVNLTLTDGSGSGVAFANTGVTASGVETVNIRVNDTQNSPSGAFNDSLTWLGNSVKTFNVSGNAGLTLSSSSTALTNVDASGITNGAFTWTSGALTSAATVKGSASGTNTVNMNSARAGVNYTGGSGNDNVTIIGTVSSTASLGNGNNSLTLGGATILGTYTAGTGTDTLMLNSPTADISNATITGFENLMLTHNANITATIAQMSQFTGNIDAISYVTLNLTTADTFNAFVSIPKYILANGTNNFTSNDWVDQVLGGSGSDTFNFTADQIVTRLQTADGGNGTDTLNIGATNTQNIDLSTKFPNIETINVAGSTGTASFTNANGAGVTLNYTKSTGNNTITLGTGGQILNLLGSSSAATTITGGAAVDTINLQTAGSGSETLIETGATMSNKTQIDVVSNFNATGTDYFKTGVKATILTSYNITTADTSDYMTQIDSMLSVFAENQTSEAFLIKIAGGTAAGTYLFENNGSNVFKFDATDFFVKLTGTVGTITAANLIA